MSLRRISWRFASRGARSEEIIYFKEVCEAGLGEVDVGMGGIFGLKERMISDG